MEPMAFWISDTLKAILSKTNFANFSVTTILIVQTLLIVQTYKKEEVNEVRIDEMGLQS
jgi:hypothetical protein